MFIRLQRKAKNLPYKWRKDPRPQKGEIFKKICDYDLAYSVSNYGRVKREKDIGRCKKGTILKPQRGKSVAKFTARLSKGKCIPVQELVYRSHIGAIPEGKQVVCKDGDRKNIMPHNLILKPKNFKRKHKKRKEQKKKLKSVNHSKQAKSEKRQKPMFVQINIHDGDKETNLMQVKAMRKGGYCLVKENNGVYDFRLIPKEGDTVKVTIEGSQIKVNRFVIEIKDGNKYYLKGVDSSNFFYSDELEIIKQS